MRTILFVLCLLFVSGPVQAEVNRRDIGFIYSGPKNDLGFAGQASRAINAFEVETGVALRRRAAVTAKETERAIRDLAGRGIGTIFLLGYKNAAVLERVAPDYPDVRFTIIDGVATGANVRSIVFREEEAGYLVGIAAGLATRSGRLGIIGGAPFPSVLRFSCGFVQGVRSVRPDASFERSFLSDDVDGFRRIDAAAAAARAMMAGGVDVIFPPAGSAAHGALRAVAGAQRLGIGVDLNLDGVFPGTVLTSAVKRVDVAVATELRDALVGKWSAGTVRLGLGEGAVGWSRDAHNEALVAPFADRIAAAEAEIKAGRLVPAQVDDVPECRP